MNIKFQAHQATEREVELTQQELFQLFEIMRREFKEHITYARFRDCYSPTATEKSIMDYCKQHGVDVEYDKDRIAFFSAILDNLKNPYQ
jgi:sialic acid synthase SpsE